MRNVIRQGLLASCSVLLIACATGAHAATLVGYPPPGLVNFSSSGSVGLAGGQTATYTFDPSAVDQLFWGPASIDMGTQDGVTTLTYLGGIGTSTATWQATVTIPNSIGGPNTFTGDFVATLSSGDWLDPSTVGISGSGSPSAVAEISSTSFVVTELFTANGTPYTTFYNADHEPDLLNQTDFTGEFYATTPIPGAVFLFAGGLGFGGMFLRKRKDALGAFPKLSSV